ncbi:MAG: hypothetical protein Aurels2KO_45590 [Aureliella sp.]
MQMDSDRPAEPINPFAPPKTAVTRAEDVRDVPPVVRRDGDLMLVGPDATLAPICFVTGEPALDTVKIDTVWQPAWVYLALLPGLVPYLFVSPWFVQHVSLDVPIGQTVIDAQRRRWQMGLVIIIAFAVAIALAILLGGSIWMIIAIGIFLFGCVVGRKPVRLNIAYADKELLILRDVHPACLEDLSSIHR